MVRKVTLSVKIQAKVNFEGMGAKPLTGSFSTEQNTVSLKYSNSASITLLERLYPVSNQNSKITKAYSELASITGHDKLEISS